MGGFIDLHLHLLPALDDGPADAGGALALARALDEAGFAEVHPTPHQKLGSWTPDLEQCRAAADLVRERLRAEGIPLKVAAPAGENMWDSLFLERQEPRSYPTYEGGRAVLVEFVPGMPPPQLDQRLFEIGLRGHLPVIAHAERYPELVADEGRARALAGRAALLVNLGSLAGAAWFGTRRLARKLVRRGLAHAAATDAHRAEDMAEAAAGARWIESKLGTEGLHRLLVEGPRSILRGEVPAS